MIDQGELSYAEALAHFDRALDGFSRALGPHAPETLHVQAQRAMTLIALENKEPLPTILEELREHLPSITPSIDRPLAESWGAVAIAADDHGAPRDALMLFDAVLDALGEGGDRALLATTLLHRATVQRHTGDLRGSIASRRRCLALRREAFGDDNARVAEARLGLARDLLADKALQAEGLGEARMAVATLKRLGLDRRPQHSTAWATLGLALLTVQNDLVGASEHFEKAAEIEEKTFGAAHRSTARMLSMTATAHAMRGNQGKAAALLARALPALEKGDEAEHYEAANRFVTALTATGRHRVCADWARKKLAEMRAPRRASAVAVYEWAIAQALLLDGKVPEAVPHLTRSRAAAAEYHGEDSEAVRGLDHSLSMLAQGARPVPRRIS